MVGAHQNLNSSRDLTTPLSGMICHSWASACCAINLTTKFELHPIRGYHIIISYIIRTNVLEHTRHTSALTVAQKHNETFQRNSTELKS